MCAGVFPGPERALCKATVGLHLVGLLSSAPRTDVYANAERITR